MIDPRTNKRVEVGRIERGGGTVLLLRDRLDEVCALLDKNAVPYWRDSISVSSNGGPYVTGITLSVKADVDLVQQLLDALP
jgi:hypothetical protein